MRTTRIRRTALTLLIILLIIACFLAPYAWVVASSLKNQFTVFGDVTPLSWRAFVPVGATIENYVSLFERTNILRALLNTAIVATGQVVFTLLLCSMAAYALTRIKFPGANVVFMLILLTFLLPIEAMMVPLYQVVSGLGLSNTLVGIMIPWIASPFGLFLLKQAFEELPAELEDAARIDGAGHVRIFFSIVLPNVKVPMVTLGLITFLFCWNSFLWPLVIVQDPARQIIQVAIAQQGSPTQLPNWGETFAGATVATVPLILLFLILQKYFTQGMATSGIKG
ncbi:multiple sugar transport system permease protein/putative chitobiose transport system permease protein [Neorhizobium galegae]|uniref:carbohydrate ABC transporter permease n=1 Tax=Neorhizobium galegae TaxID=399 RepID=UPI001AE7D651|nr:carbohydrate ABC transporter permease [Neorhizobium galegae]MBP2562116.1 multiple sugar transport system permease protein/putative chitobiose transport system permease protein [Neorhizobium galegae]MDQ0133903.1 multiple sugar transport system permease protein/putative chitobiose transport system permease protein [Neorhizobium galegae]